MSTHQPRQPYDLGFAAVYDVYLGGIGNHVARKLIELCRTHQILERDACVLDIGCGTGIAAREFVKAGWRVTGIDLSPYMLRQARAKLSRSIRAGRASLKVADARSFKVGRGYSFVYSVLDCIDHLPDSRALRGCFSSAHAAAAPGALFVFSLVTARGMEQFSGFTAKDGHGGSIAIHGVYDASSSTAVLEVVGYRPVGAGLFRRFATVMQLTVHDPRRVRVDLAASGWKILRISTLENLGIAAKSISKADRIFFVCSKPRASSF